MTARPARFARSCLRLLVRAALLVVLAVELLYLGRAYLLADLARSQIVHFAEQALGGGRLQLGALEGDWFRHVRCDRIEYRGTGLLQSVHGGEIELWVDPFRLLRGDLGGLRAARVNATALVLDLDAAGSGSHDKEPQEPVDPGLQRLLAGLFPDGARATIDRLTLRGHGQEAAGAVDVAVAPRGAATAPRRAELDAPELAAHAEWQPDQSLTVELRSTAVTRWLAPLGVVLPAELALRTVRGSLTADASAVNAQLEATGELPAWLGAGGPCSLAATVHGDTVHGDAAAIRLTSLRVEAPAWQADGRAELRAGVPDLFAHPERLPLAAIAADLVLRRCDLARFDAAALGLLPMTGGISGALTLGGTLAAPEPGIDLALAVGHFGIAGSPGAALTGRVQGDPRRLRVTGLTVAAAEQELRVDGSWTAARPLWDLPLEGVLQFHAALPKGGHADATCALDQSGLRSGTVRALLPGLVVDGTGLELPWHAASGLGWLGHGRGTLAVDLTQVGALRAALPAAVLPPTEGIPDDLSLRARAALDRGWLEVLELEATGAGLHLFVAPSSVPLATANAGAAAHAAAWLALREPPRVAWPAGLPQPREGLVALVLSGESGQVTVDLHIRDAQQSGRAFGTILLARHDGWLAVPDLTVVTAAPGALGLGQLRGALQLGPTARVVAADLQASWDGRVAALGGPPVRAAVELHADRQRIQTRVTASHGAVQVEGEVALLGGSVSDLEQGGTTLCAAPLAGSLRVAELDLALLPFASLGIDDLGGKVTGEFALGGTVEHPAPRFVAAVTGGWLRAAGSPRLEQVEARILASPTQVRIERLEASSGLGPLSVQGTIDLPASWSDGLGSGRVALSLRGSDVLLYRRGGIKLRGDLDLRAEGPLSGVTLSGRVELHSGRYVAHIPYWDPTRAGGDAAVAGLVIEGPRLRPWARVQLDIAVTTREPFRVDTNVLRTGISGALRVTGPIEAPTLQGDLTASEGRLALPGLNFELQSLLLHLDRDRPRFPEVTLLAQGRRHGYDVVLRVRGPLDDPEVVLSATPTLTPEQLAVLVTTGIAPSVTNRDRLLGAGTALGTYLVAEIADYLFGSDSTEAKETFLARLRIETGNEVSRTGNESIMAEFRLFDRFYLQGERDVHNQMNLGLVYRVKFR